MSVLANLIRVFDAEEKLAVEEEIVLELQKNRAVLVSIKATLERIADSLEKKESPGP